MDNSELWYVMEKHLVKHLPLVTWKTKKISKETVVLGKKVFIA